MRDRHVGTLSIPVIKSGIVTDNGVHSGERRLRRVRYGVSTLKLFMDGL